MYVGEYRVWVGPLNSNPGLSQGDWMGAMLSFYGNATNVLFCPTAPDKGNPSGAGNHPPGSCEAAWHWTLSDPVYASSYGYNSWLAGGLGNASAFYPDGPYKNDSTVESSVLTPMSAWIPLGLTLIPLRKTHRLVIYTMAIPIKKECHVSRLHDTADASAGSAPRNVPIGTPMVGAINTGFADGHAENVKLENLWTLYWHRGWKNSDSPSTVKSTAVLNA